MSSSFFSSLEFCSAPDLRAAQFLITWELHFREGRPQAPDNGKRERVVGRSFTETRHSCEIGSKSGLWRGWFRGTTVDHYYLHLVEIGLLNGVDRESGKYPVPVLRYSTRDTSGKVNRFRRKFLGFEWSIFHNRRSHTNTRTPFFPVTTSAEWPRNNPGNKVYD